MEVREWPQLVFLIRLWFAILKNLKKQVEVIMKESDKFDKDLPKMINGGTVFLLRLSMKQRENLLNALRQIRDIHKSDLSKGEKVKEIKKCLWIQRSVKYKLVVGAFIGAVTGLAIFGTGGIGVVALGGGVGVAGWLASAAGGVVVASIIKNFE